MVGAWGLIVYVLVGYPLIVIGMGRLFRRRQSPVPVTDDDLPRVTIVIAAYNEAAVIEERVANALALDYPEDMIRVLVVADGSDDGTAELVHAMSDPRVSVTAEGPRLGKSAALTRVVPLVDSDVALFSDANNTYEKDALRLLVAHFADPCVGAVTGAKRVTSTGGSVSEGEGFYWRYESAIKEAETSLGSCVAVVGEILAVRTELWQPIPAEIINDDFFIAMNVLNSGFDVAYEPLAISWEPSSQSVADDRKRRERIVAGRVQAIAIAPRLLPWRRPLVVWQVVSHKLLRPFIPAAAGIGLVSTIAATWSSIRTGRGRTLPIFALLAQGVLYAAAAIGRRPGSGRVPRVAAYLVDSHRSSLIGSISYLKGQQNAVWEKVDRTNSPSPTGRE